MANPGRQQEISNAMRRITLGFVEHYNFYSVTAPLIAGAFDRAFTAEELRGLAAFFATPLGRKLAEQQQGPLAEAARQAVALIFATAPGQAALGAGIAELTSAGVRVPAMPAN